MEKTTFKFKPENFNRIDLAMLIFVGAWIGVRFAEWSDRPLVWLVPLGALFLASHIYFVLRFYKALHDMMRDHCSINDKGAKSRMLRPWRWPLFLIIVKLTEAGIRFAFESDRLSSGILYDAAFSIGFWLVILYIWYLLSYRFDKDIYPLNTNDRLSE